MGAAPGPCPAWRPRAPGLGLGAHAMASPVQGGGAAAARRGEGAGPAQEDGVRGCGRIRGGVRARTPGPARLRGTQSAGGRGARAGHPLAASRGGRGAAGTTGSLGCGPGEDSPRILKSTSGVAGHPLGFRAGAGPEEGGEAGRRSREPPTCGGACARWTLPGPGKGKKKNTAGKSAQAQSAGWKGGRGAETRKCLLRVRRIQIRGVKKERYLCACVHPAWPALSPGSAPPEDHPYPDVTSVAFSPPRAASPSGPALRPRVSRSALRNRQK